MVDEFDGVAATCIDVGNPCVFVSASAVGAAEGMTPDDVTADADLLRRLDSIRRQAGVAMGIASSRDKVPGSIPKIAMLHPAKKAPDGKTLASDLRVQAMSVGQPHKAVPITVAMALASATTLQGSTAHTVCKSVSGTPPDKDGVTIAHPTGKILVSSMVDDKTGDIKTTSVFRTARLLMSGEVSIK